MRGGLVATDGSGRADPAGFAEPVVSLRMVAAVPWRGTPSARGAHYPGCYWSATTSTHVIYESRLELARLLIADFDPAVTAIAA